VDRRKARGRRGTPRPRDFEQLDAGSPFVDFERDTYAVMPHALQDQLKVVALAEWGKGEAPLEPGAPIPLLRRPDTTTPDDLMFFEVRC
jgi:hypothetical protein